jgi:hypothetical protein
MSHISDVALQLILINTNTQCGTSSSFTRMWFHAATRGGGCGKIQMQDGARIYRMQCLVILFKNPLTLRIDEATVVVELSAGVSIAIGIWSGW